MSGPSPSFFLAPCPACSNLHVIERPSWRYAHNTSRARGRNCYALVGCKHVAEICAPEKIRDDPEEWTLIEEAWKARAEQLLALVTEGWTPQAIAGFTRSIYDKASFPGMTEQLDLSPAHPAQQEKHEPTKE